MARLDHGKIIKGLEKAIEWDRQSRIQRIQEDQATAEHDEHDDGYDIHPDLYCRVCREDGYLRTEEDWQLTADPSAIVEKELNDG